MNKSGRSIRGVRFFEAKGTEMFAIRRIQIEAMLVALLALSACTVSPAINPTAAKPVSDLTTEYGCLPPCWKSITIGESKAEDLLHVLESDPSINPQSIQSNLDRNTSMPPTIWWCTSANGADCPSASAWLGSDNVIIRLDLVTDNEISLETLLSTLGEPDYYHVQTIQPHNTSLSVMWLSVGLEATFDNPKSPLQPDILVHFFRYFPPAPTLERYLTMFDYTEFELEIVTKEYEVWEGPENIRLRN